MSNTELGIIQNYKNKWKLKHSYLGEENCIDLRIVFECIQNMGSLLVTVKKNDLRDRLVLGQKKEKYINIFKRQQWPILLNKWLHLLKCWSRIIRTKITKTEIGAEK